MLQLLRLSWRDLWRNGRRTVLTGLVMAFSVGCMVLLIAFGDGRHTARNGIMYLLMLAILSAGVLTTMFMVAYERRREFGVRLALAASPASLKRASTLFSTHDPMVMKAAGRLIRLKGGRTAGEEVQGRKE